jgi:hypothetical protein
MTGTNRLSQIPERLRTTGTRIKDGNRLPDNSPSRHKPGVSVAWTGGAVRREGRKGFRMAGEQDVETAKRGYAAFSAGDAVAAMEVLADDAASSHHQLESRQTYDHFGGCGNIAHRVWNARVEQPKARQRDPELARRPSRIPLTILNSDGGFRFDVR